MPSGVTSFDFLFLKKKTEMYNFKMEIKHPPTCNEKKRQLHGPESPVVIDSEGRAEGSVSPHAAPRADGEVQRRHGTLLVPAKCGFNHAPPQRVNHVFSRGLTFACLPENRKTKRPHQRHPARVTLRTAPQFGAPPPKSKMRFNLSIFICAF